MLLTFRWSPMRTIDVHARFKSLCTRAMSFFPSLWPPTYLFVLQCHCMDTAHELAHLQGFPDLLVFHSINDSVVMVRPTLLSALTCIHILIISCTGKSETWFLGLFLLRSDMSCERHGLKLGARIGTLRQDPGEGAFIPSTDEDLDVCLHGACTHCAVYLLNIYPRKLLLLVRALNCLIAILSTS